MNRRLFWIVMALLGIGLVALVARDLGGNDTFGFRGDPLARIIVLSVLATVVLTALFNSRLRLGQVARGIGLWVLVLLALVAGYQYRYELQDIASRITAGLIPGSPLALGEDDGRATVTLEKRPNGHFEATVIIDGAPVSVVVDTGATSTVLTRRDAEQAGFDPQALSFSIPVSTANGVALAARVTASEMSIGNIVRRNLPILVTDAGMLDQSLLGMNFIGSLSGFDMRGDRMILRD